LEYGNFKPQIASITKIYLTQLVLLNSISKQDKLC